MSQSSPRTQEERIAAIAEMRSRMLNLTLGDLRLTKLPEGRRLIGLLMETGYEEAAISLVVIIDGTVSLYFSNGGGTIGAGEHEPVRTAAAEFIDAAEQFCRLAEPVDDAPLPEDGQVVFYFITDRELLSYSAPEIELGEKRDAMSPLFFAGHAVLSELRGLEEPGNRGA